VADEVLVREVAVQAPTVDLEAVVGVRTVQVVVVELVVDLEVVVARKAGRAVVVVAAVHKVDRAVAADLEAWTPHKWWPG